MKIEDVKIGMKVLSSDGFVLVVESIDTIPKHDVNGYTCGFIHAINFVGRNWCLTSSEIEPLFSGYCDGKIGNEHLIRNKARNFSDVKIYFEGFNKCELKPIPRICRCTTEPVYIQQLGQRKKQKESKMSDLKVGDTVSIVNTKGFRRIIDVSISGSHRLDPIEQSLISFNEWDNVKDCKFRILDVKENGRYSLAGVFGKSFDRDDLKKVETKRRMTNLELAKWSEMHGQVEFNGIVCAKWSYKIGEDSTPCFNNVSMRGWNTTEWIEPEVNI